jgi:hypothetical protein
MVTTARQDLRTVGVTPGGVGRRPQGMVEPLVGQIKAKGHANRFRRGGRSAVRSEWRLLADHLTRATGGELVLDRRLDRSDPQLLQPPDLGTAEVA